MLLPSQLQLMLLLPLLPPWASALPLAQSGNRTEAGTGSELKGDASLPVQVSGFSGYGRSETDGGGLSGRGGASGLGRGRW